MLVWLFNLACYAVGGYIVLMVLFSLCQSLYVALAPAFVLLERYGKGSWAVVTGASDGIGEGFCYELARDGFNVCLISRSEDKLKRVEEKVRQVNPKIQTKIVVADFKRSAESGFFDDLMLKVGDIDVGLLVNNVGMKNQAHFEQVDVQAFIDQTVVNTFPMVILSRRMIPKMLLRPQKSGVINVSSVRSLVPFPFMPGYSATKRFNDLFSRGISYEFQDKVDIMSLRPMYVTSQMTHQIKGLHVISPKECARGAMNKLGVVRATSGHWKHRIQASLLGCVPTSLIYMIEGRRTRRLIAMGSRDGKKSD